MTDTIDENKPQKVIRLYQCPTCLIKYFPNKGWDRYCDKCDTLCKMLIEDEPEPRVEISHE